MFLWLVLLFYLIIAVHPSEIHASLLYPDARKRFGVDIDICPKMDQTDIDILEREVGAGWFMNWNISQWEKYGGTYAQ